MHNPYEERFPQTGRLPLAVPSDGGTGGIGSDGLGTQFRDWSIPPILARITAHSTDNIYSWVQVFLSDDAGTYETLVGGLSGTDTAFEVNGSSTVDADPSTGVIVELWPTYGTPGFWSFTDNSGSNGSLSEYVVATSLSPAAGSGVGAECYAAVVKEVSATVLLASLTSGETVWLTISNAGVASVPISGQHYVCRMTTDTLTICGSSRLRAFGQYVLPTTCVSIPDFSSPGMLDCDTGTITWSDTVKIRVIDEVCP